MVVSFKIMCLEVIYCFLSRLSRFKMFCILETTTTTAATTTTTAATAATTKPKSFPEMRVLKKGQPASLVRGFQAASKSQRSHKGDV